MCSGQTLWLLGVSGMIIEREARKDIPLLFVRLEPSLLVPLRSIAGRNCSGVSFIEESQRYLCLSCGGVAVMSRFWLRGCSLI